MSLYTARQRLDRSMSEDQLQQAVQDMLDLFGWRWWHDNDPRRNKAGFLDIHAVRPPRVLFIELKSQRGGVRPEQDLMLALYSKCPGVESYLWRPSDWSHGEVEAVLR